MIIRFLSLFLLVAMQIFAAENPQEIDPDLNVLDNIIELTKENLQNEMKLREKVIQYRKAYDEYVEQSQNRDLFLRVAKAAFEAEKAIKATNLSHAFSPGFMHELTLFAQVVQKHRIQHP